MSVKRSNREICALLVETAFRFTAYQGRWFQDDDWVTIINHHNPSVSITRLVGLNMALSKTSPYKEAIGHCSDNTTGVLKSIFWVQEDHPLAERFPGQND